MRGEAEPLNDFKPTLNSQVPSQPATHAKNSCVSIENQGSREMTSIPRQKRAGDLQQELNKAKTSQPVRSLSPDAAQTIAHHQQRNQIKESSDRPFTLNTLDS